MSERKTTNILLLIIALPILFWVLKILSFIFIPLIFSMFIALMFLPLMRKLKKKRISNTVSLVIVVAIISVFFYLTSQLIMLSSQEITAADNDFFSNAEEKIKSLIYMVEDFLGIAHIEGESVGAHYLEKADIGGKFGATMGSIGSMISMTMMTAFFTILLLAESLNFHKILQSTLVKQSFSSIKVFIRIEQDIITFIKVKFVISFLTGVGFSAACYFFDVSFPIFWGLLAFLFNFVQMIGSIVSVILLAIFALVDLDLSSTLVFFIISISAVEVVFGAILEPVYMGKSFSINVITILVMLMFWGFIWGVPGMILSIPITVFLKIIFEQFKKTKMIADLMAG